MQSDAQSLREDLYRVIEHYSDLAKLAKKGEVDPINRIGKIIKQTAPYLLLVIRDILPKIERDEMDYHEALLHVIVHARNFPDNQSLIDGKNEIQKIEERGKLFLYGVKWLDMAANQRPTTRDVPVMSRKLRELNEKYKKRYVVADAGTTTLIPCFFPQQEESPEAQVSRMADLVQRAMLEMHHLMIENEPEKSYYLWSNSSRKEVEANLFSLAWFLFRCGRPVDRIATGYYKDVISDFLNEKLLDYLLDNIKKVETLQGISTHLLVMSYIDFLNFFDLSTDYIDFDNSKEVSKRIKLIKSRKRKGWSLLQKLQELHKTYGELPQGRLPQSFLLFRYYSSFGDYRGSHRPIDIRIEQAVKIYKPILDKTAMEKKAEDDLLQSGKSFSSKTREEMSDLLRLIMNSLAEPGKIAGKKVKILGDISSGAMGKVCIGIFRKQIVALKKVKAGVASSLGDPVALLEYEAALHARVQTPDQHPYIVDYFGLIEQDGERLLINGYHPNDNLTQLVERNWLEKHKPPFSTQSKITAATLEVLINQLLECLRVFRSKGVIHRDLKTDNILYMVDENGELNSLKIIDFGVALVVGQGGVNDMFRGKVVGTFAYMAPEQAKGKSMLQSDLYSVGVILTVILTGKLPMVFPKTRTRQELVKQILRIESESRPRITQLNPWLKKNTHLEHIAVTVERMLDLDPFKRPTIEEAQEAFDGLFQHMGDEKYALSIFYHKG